MNKNYFSSEVDLGSGKSLTIAGPLAPDTIRELEFHHELVAFRTPAEQKTALIEISELPEGRIIGAIDGNTLVGYITFHYPDPFERWAEGNMDDLLELGAIEVSKEYRAFGLAKKMMKIAFMDPEMDNFIVISTEYYWHWDLKNTGLSVWDYRKIMEKIMSSVGMEYFATDDPEICSHPANLLMARIGPNVPMESMETFDNLRFKNRHMF
ncbi:hypothetical protein BHU72_01535 [Desulfuribacillus stibiiarsenatis]|uniref:N-acetyltransferase domain-containing protein n=1 Tax=Desulfuribacillus stibiiarsenatis TaxID=1390249 RepID=A0A1E5LA11_9FIRM|nr:GNAT family N-acetyltransferase [Desulfuribacillus stibiiarsenatis]OEH86966.1 hypothetical protein BHU72_01535 [Desulfuribacillus stibiiarsenatis]